MYFLYYIIFLFFAFFSLNAQETNATSKELFANLKESSVNFYVNKILVKEVEGSFTNYSIVANINQKNILTNFKALIDTNSIKTDSKKRDKVLRSEEFFFVKKYSNFLVSFKEVIPNKKKTNYGKLKVTFKIRNIKKAILLDYRIIKKKDYYKIYLTGKLNRFDFKLGPDYGTFKIAEEIRLRTVLKFLLK